MCSFIASFYALIGIFHVFKAKSLKKWFSLFALDAIIISYLFQPTAIKELIQIFKCKTIDGKNYILNSLNTSCDDSEYFDWRNNFYLPNLLFWIIIFPFSCLVAMIYNSKKLDHPQMKLFFGFFYLGYRPELYFWDFLVIYKKILTIFITLLPDEMIFSKCYILLVLNAEAAYLQKVKIPFKDRGLSNIEFKSNIAALFTILFGLFYIFGVSEKVSILIFCCLIFVNSHFLIVWFKFYLFVSLKDISKNNFVKKKCPSLPTKLLFCIKGEFFNFFSFKYVFIVFDDIFSLNFKILCLKNLKKYVQKQTFKITKDLADFDRESSIRKIISS